jgi:hypothetical protein
MNALKILTEARAAIENPARWAASYDEVSFEKDCASTAIGWDYDAHVAFARANGIDLTDGAYSAVMDFNDSHSHAEVLAAFNNAIASLPQDERHD